MASIVDRISGFFTRRKVMDGGGGSVPPSSSGPPPAADPPKKTRPWRLTEYYVASQSEHPGERTVPIFDPAGKLLIRGSVSFFASLSLEGSGIIDGKLLNVSGGWVNVEHRDYEPVLAFHRKFVSKKPPTYSGIWVEGDRVVRALAYHVTPKEKMGLGYGVCNGIPLDPYRTVAADIGRGKKSDPRYKRVGGVVPVGTRVYIEEFAGRELGGKPHDGWVTVNDTGGGIFGAHFDVFVGRRGWGGSSPHRGMIWFEGVDRLEDPYTYGLEDD